MKHFNKLFIVPLSILLVSYTIAGGKKFPAFPGAQGFGAYTPGGRGGKVLIVTNLSDYNPKKENSIPGSLREAVSEKGPRIIVFRVAGNIELKTDLKITDPYITIAGQSAPGGGICLQNYPLVIATHDAVVRYIRSRPGDLKKRQADAITLDHAANVIVDHCSVSWSIDEDLSTQLSTGGNTVQWCILAEPLSHSYHHKGEHSKASIISGPTAYIYNLYAHSSSRNPRPNKDLVDFRNNVIYDYGYRPGYTARQPVRLNYVGNYLKPGPSTHKDILRTAFELGGPETKIYADDNKFYEEQKASDTKVPFYVKLPHVKDAKLFLDTSKENLINATIMPMPFAAAPVKTYTPGQAYKMVLADAGAILPERDAVDKRIVNDVINGTGHIIDSQSQVGGWPKLAPGKPQLDSDNDGMPDKWEEKYGLNPHDPSDSRGDADHDGFTNIEEYLNGTDPLKPFVWVEPPEIGPERGDIFLKSSTVSIISDEPDCKIYYTTDGSEPTQSSKLCKGTFDVSKNTLVRARAFDTKGDGSYTVYASFRKVKPLASVDVSGLQSGLDYIYYETKRWRRLSVVYDIKSPSAEGTAKNFDLSVRKRDYGYGLRFIGYIKIPVTGMYKFYDTSASGSDLFIGQDLVVDNAGKHDIQAGTGKIALEKGFHPITVTYFMRQEKGSEMRLSIKLEGPGFNKAAIPDSMLFRPSMNLLDQLSPRK